MLKAIFKKYVLTFKQASGTSRGILKTKETFFLFLENQESEGIGECGLFRGLSVDDRADYEEKLKWTCEHINLGQEVLLDELKEYPSIQFGLEQAFLSLISKNKFELFDTPFVHGNEPIPINGLVWMGNPEFMQKQLENKLKSGFRTIKMKIGAIDFEQECEILGFVRQRFSASEIELRVDANGAFTPDEAMQKLEKLATFDLHSIEQPIKQGQISEMVKLCSQTPLPIALDEELIGVFTKEGKENLIKEIKPQYIILKPSLVGGINGSNEWISIAAKYNVDWWITSALESNIGLNAIAQYTSSLKPTMPQGLGTGGLFLNNVDAPLSVRNGNLWYHSSKRWGELKL
jgi:o-succinylbenzoate synthase